ncbi:MAG: NAD+ synthase [Spirochaetaceae bacterium]|nr:MAG: NAD+ synthase [Spirochaetaceae bacterium]
MKIAIGQINPTIGDFVGNATKILGYVDRAHKKGADVVVFPEMCVCGYPPMDLLDHGSFVEANLKTLRLIQQQSPKGIGIVLGYVDKNRSASGKALVNAVSLIHDGEVLFTQAKSLLPTYDVFDEARYFQPADERRTVSFKGEQIGIAICEDIWWETDQLHALHYPVDPVKELLDKGATLLFSPSASPFYSGKLDVRYGLLSGIGKSSGVPVVYVNMVGGNDSLIFDGRSLVTAADGTLSFLGSSFEEQLAFVNTDTLVAKADIEVDRYEEIEQALVLGIRDYLGKCGFKRVHVGLSGGIDSSVVAVLAQKAVGADNVTVFALPSRYSSPGSRDDAAQLARNLGVQLHRLSIEGMFEAGLQTLAPVFKGKSVDATEENLQARIRGLLLMAFSNKFHSLLLTTGNKSELATGYCTLYGDMCGVLAVIGDLFKTEVYALARSLNREKEVIPASVLTKVPSAELRPDQADQDSLPPYDLLDQILQLYLLQSKTVEEITALGYEAGLVRSVLNMVGKAEFKRRQAPPVLKVSPRAFGTGRRIPIARVIHEA